MSEGRKTRQHRGLDPWLILPYSLLPPVSTGACGVQEIKDPRRQVGDVCNRLAVVVCGGGHGGWEERYEWWGDNSVVIEGRRGGRRQTLEQRMYAEVIEAGNFFIIIVSSVFCQVCGLFWDFFFVRRGIVDLASLLWVLIVHSPSSFYCCVHSVSLPLIFCLYYIVIDILLVLMSCTVSPHNMYCSRSHHLL